MAASYPVSIKTFSPKQDATMFILAAHVNDLQNEVAAVEQTLGTIPAEWDNGPTLVKLYPTVKARLDDAQNTLAYVQTQISGIIQQLTAIGPLSQRVTDLETAVSRLNSQITAVNSNITAIIQRLTADEVRITNLENNTGGVSGSIQNLQNQINALQLGDAASILNTGQTVIVDPYAWTIMNWNAVEYDNVGIFSGGSSLFCPQDGWWLINLMFYIPNTGGGPSPTTSLANLGLRINGNEVAATSEGLQLGIGGNFRLNTSWSGPWHRGSFFQAALNINPHPGPAPSAQGRVSFTRLHGL